MITRGVQGKKKKRRPRTQCNKVALNPIRPEIISHHFAETLFLFVVSDIPLS